MMSKSGIKLTWNSQFIDNLIGKLFRAIPRLVHIPFKLIPIMHVFHSQVHFNRLQHLILPWLISLEILHLSLYLCHNLLLMQASQLILFRDNASKQFSGHMGLTQTPLESQVELLPFHIHIQCDWNELLHFGCFIHLGTLIKLLLNSISCILLLEKTSQNQLLSNLLL